MHKLGYFPGISLIHKLYPITKFIWLLIGSVVLFFIRSSWLVVMTAFVFLTTLIFIQPGICKLRGFRLALSTGLLLLILYLFFEKTGDIIVLASAPSLLRITSGGLQKGLLVSGRFLAIMFLSYLFIVTTSPNQLAYGLMKLGIPYRYGFMLVTALRLAPTLEEEGQTIYRAQLVRGVKYDRKNFKRFLLLIRQFLSPLLFGALRKADKLVFSMEGRGFGKYATRTFHEQTSPGIVDLYFSIGLLLFLSSLLILDIGGIL
jgi:energy-coupling factor transport system permease protein